MKYLLVVIYSFLILSCAVTRPRYSPPTDLEKNNLHGPVARTESRYLNLDGYGIDDPERPTDFDMVIVSVYNEQGNIVSEETYGAGGATLSKRDLYTFDDSGLLVQSSQYHDLLNNKVTWLLYDYDPRGRLERYRSIGGEWETEFTVDGRGYPVGMVSRGADTVHTVYRYDGRGRLKRESRGPELEYHTDYSYHRNGKLKTVANPSQTEQYDADGNLIRTVITITVHGQDGTTEVKDGVIEATYRYDQRGNWTVRELISDGETFGAWVRTIEYRQ